MDETCFHGGAFFEAIGPRFDDLDRRRAIINADVLDAWFPPAPGVVAAVAGHLPWLLQTSPPTHAEGLVAAIAEARGLPPESVIVGAGSSDLIFRAFTSRLTRASRALILDPMYGEYVHVLERVVGCRVARVRLGPRGGFDLDPGRLLEGGPYDLIAIVNPNNPTGRHVPRARLEPVLADIPRDTLVWIDEAYVDYVGAAESLERFAAASANVVVCKSMSKVYALSGARVAYLSAPPSIARLLRPLIPPWAVSLPAQVAAVAALADPEYYAGRHRETRALRSRLESGVAALGFEVFPGLTNSVLARAADAESLVAGCRRHELFIRPFPEIAAVRFAVKDEATNARMLAILATLLPWRTSTP